MLVSAFACARGYQGCTSEHLYLLIVVAGQYCHPGHGREGGRGLMEPGVKIRGASNISPILLSGTRLGAETGMGPSGSAGLGITETPVWNYGDQLCRSGNGARRIGKKKCAPGGGPLFCGSGNRSAVAYGDLGGGLRIATFPGRAGLPT